MIDFEHLPPSVQRPDNPDLWVNEEIALATFSCAAVQLYAAVESRSVRVIYAPLTRPFDGSTEPLLFIPDLERTFGRRHLVLGEISEGAKGVTVGALGGAGGTLLANRAGTAETAEPAEPKSRLYPRPFFLQRATDAKVFRVTLDYEMSLAKIQLDTYQAQFAKPPKHASLILPNSSSILLKGGVMTVGPLDERWSFRGTIRSSPGELVGKYVVQVSSAIGDLTDTFKLED